MRNGKVYSFHSGAQVSVRTRSGSNFISRSTSLNADHPALQWVGPTGRQLGQPYRAGSLGGAFSGPVVPDNAFYNIAFQAGQRTTGLRTLLNASPEALQANGIAVDSVARFVDVLSRLGIPAVAGGSPTTGRSTDVGSFLASLDFSPATSASSQAIGVVVGAAWDHDATIAQLPTDVPARAGHSETWNANVQLTHSAYVGGVVLTETTVGMTTSRSATDPFVRLPNGTTVVNPGSVGCPAYQDPTGQAHVSESGTPHARYALLDVEDGKDPIVMFLALVFDHESAAKRAEINGRPEWAHALRTGFMPRAKAQREAQVHTRA